VVSKGQEKLGGWYGNIRGGTGMGGKLALKKVRVEMPDLLGMPS